MNGDAEEWLAESVYVTVDGSLVLYDEEGQHRPCLVLPAEQWRRLEHVSVGSARMPLGRVK